MDFFSQGVDVLKVIITVIGAGILIFGAIELLMAHFEQNSAKKSAGIAGLVAGGGIIFIAQILIPALKTMMTM